MENDDKMNNGNNKEVANKYKSGFKDGATLAMIGGIMYGVSISLLWSDLYSTTQKCIRFISHKNEQMEKGYAHPSDISIYLEDKDADGKDELYFQHKNLSYGVLYDPQTNRCSIRPYRIIMASDHTQRPQIVYEDGGK